MNVDGFMIETHINPDIALSDSDQQLTPTELQKLLGELKFRKNNFQNNEIISELEQLRFQIDSLDYQMIELLAKRMNIIKKIGDYKNTNNISIFQVDRWREIKDSRIKAGEELNLDLTFVKEIMQLLHNQSIRTQSKK